MGRSSRGSIDRDSCVAGSKNEFAVGRNRPVRDPFRSDRNRLPTTEVHEVDTHAVPGFAGVEGDAFSVRQEMSSAILNVQPGYGNRPGLTRTSGNELHLTRAARENGNRPLAVRGKVTCTSFAQLHRR